MGRKLLIAAGTLALILIFVVWQRGIFAQSEVPQSLTCEPGIITWLSGTGPARTPVMIHWQGRIVGGGSSDAAGHWALPLIVGRERPGVYLVEVRARGNRALIGAFQCAIGAGIPTPAALLAPPTIAPTELPIIEPTAEPTIIPTPTTVSDFTPEPTAASDITPAPTDTLAATPDSTELGTAPQAGDCPPGYPIKGSIAVGGVSDGAKVYRVPGDNGYDTAIPERCFSGTLEAEAAGYYHILE